MGVGWGELSHVERHDSFWKENVSVVYFESDDWELWVMRNYPL